MLRRCGAHAPFLILFLLGAFLLVRLGERRGGELARVGFLHLLHAQLAIAFARGDGNSPLRIDLEGDEDARVAGRRRGDAVDDPPALVAQLLRAAPRSADDVDGDASIAVVQRGEALGGAGGNLAPPLDELGGGPAGLLDADRLRKRWRRRALLAGRHPRARDGGEEEGKGGAAGAKDAPGSARRQRSASSSDSARMRSASSTWPFDTMSGGEMRRALL